MCDADVSSSACKSESASLANCLLSTAYSEQEGAPPSSTSGSCCSYGQSDGVASMWSSGTASRINKLDRQPHRKLHSGRRGMRDAVANRKRCHNRTARPLLLDDLRSLSGRLDTLGRFASV